MSTRSKRLERTVALVTAALILVAVGCASEPEKFSEVGRAVDGGDSGDWDCGSDCAWDSSDDPGAGGSGSADDAMAASREAEDAGLTAEGVAPSTTVAPLPRTGPVEERPLVNAGSIDDNEAWEDYLLYRQWFDALTPRPEVLDIRVEGRQVLTVVDATGRPVPGAAVSVRDTAGTEVAALTTYADGRALFHPPTDEVDPNSQRRPGYEVVVTPPSWATGEPVRETLATEASEHTIELGEVGAPAGVQLDVAFLLDATGSMGDEIDRLKANMVSVAEQIAALPGSPDVRFALTVYRDHGDAFVTRTLDFTGDVGAFTEGLREVVADGGGDWPEALEEGLHEVLATPSWRGDEAIKLVFLVADAPPHVGGDGPDYATDIRQAAAEGVKVFPIASSGLADDAQGEYVFRQLAQITMARFVFLTYGADGASPGESTEHQVDPDAYSVLPLDELIVRLVADELVA